MVSTLGMRETVVYFSAREPLRAGRVLATGTIMTLIAAPVLIVAAYPFVPYVLAGQRPPVIAAGQLYLIILVPLMILIYMPQHALRARDELVAWNVVRLAPAFSWVIVLLVAWALHWSDARSFAFGFAISLALLVLPSWIVAVKLVAKPVRPEKALVKPMLDYGLPSLGATLPQSLNARMPQIVIAAMLPAEALGLYAVALSWSAACMPAMEAISTLVLARVASQQSDEARRVVFSQTIRMTVLLATGLGVILALATPFAVVILFGPAFRGSIPAAIVLCIASVCMGVVYVAEEALRGLGNTKAIVPCELAGLILNTVALFFFLRPLGLFGAALASLLSTVAIAFLVILVIRRNSGVPLKTILCPRRADVALLGRRIRQTFDRLHGRETEPVIP